MPREIVPAYLGLIVKIDRQRDDDQQDDLAGQRPLRPVQEFGREHERDNRDQSNRKKQNHPPPFHIITLPKPSPRDHS